MTATMQEDGVTDRVTDAPAVRPRLIAFYLTQFHPVPENDAWWGKGFTEWTNVTKAQPLFDGHYQPHLPTDFGFYDLRVRATRHDQIRVAKEYGIDGFCYHYYWFSGKRLLDAPLDDMLADPNSDMPFCLCWANENWTRRWDAAEHEVLIAQRYLPDDDLEFIKSLQPFFTDPRYIRIDGKPILVVYRPQHLPDARKTATLWRTFCRTAGIGEIHLCAALTHGNTDYTQFGFDSGVEFPPHNLQCANQAGSIAFHEPFRGNAVDYAQIATACLEREYPHANVFRSVFPAWDNTARTGNRSLIVLGSSPENYECWLSGTIVKTLREYPEREHGRERLIFINAWNEWAEGCHLEPDRRYQRRFLEATRAARENPLAPRAFAAPDSVQTGAAASRGLWADLRAVAVYHSFLLAGRLATMLKKYPRLRKMVRRLFGRFS